LPVHRFVGDPPVVISLTEYVRRFSKPDDQTT
jgi:hypothetical protein